MKKIELDTKLSKTLEDFAFAKIKTRSLFFTPLAEAKVKNETFTLVGITPKENSNSGGLTLAVNQDGKIFSEEELVKVHGKDIFAPEKISLALLPREAVTITPNINNLILNLCDKFGEKLLVNVPKMPHRSVDIYFLADTTGSMSSTLSTVKSNINAIMTSISSSVPNVAFGAGNYKDFPASSNAYCFKNDISITTNTAPVAAAINTWTAAQGGDGSEGQLFALSKVTDAATIGWRSNSLRIVVWFGDAPGHDPICTSISSQVTSNITEATTTSLLTTAKIRVLGISVSGGLGLDGNPNTSASDYTGACPPAGNTGQATRITNATQGSLMSGVSAADIANAIVQIVQNTLYTIGNISLIPSASIEPFICSINPKAGYSNLDAKEPHQLEFVVCFRGVVPCKEKDQLFKGTIDVVMDGVTVASKKVLIEVPACKSKGKCQCGCCD